MISRLMVAAFALAAATPKEAFPVGQLSEKAKLEEVPVGITASKDGRIFVSFSRAIDDQVTISVAELKNGKPVAYPPGFLQDDGAPAQDRLLSVQSVLVDEKNRLWMLDCAKVGTRIVEPGSAKLVGVDLKTNKVVKTITFPAELAGKTSFLNDLRIDVKRGTEGTAFLTDASGEGPNGFVVVDLASGKAVRRLADHESTKADKKVVPEVMGKKLLQKGGPQLGAPFLVGGDGIALSNDGAWLYYSPLTSRKLFRISAEALADTTKDEKDVAKTIEDLGDKKFAADGLWMDSQNRLYVTDYENSAIHRRSDDGKWELVVKDEKLAWPDTMAQLADGTLLVTATQIDKSARFRGWDQRQRPFVVYAIKTQ